MPENDTNDLMALDLEYRLTIAHRMRCDCARYFVKRREVLLPEVIKEAKRRNADVVDLFATYARGVHHRHEAGLSLAATR